MPVKRVYKKKKAAPRKVVKSTVNRNMVNMGLGFPKKMEFTHRYVDAESITSTSGIINTRIFSCNGMYDPNITNTGHQPAFFDVCSNIFDHYTVIKSKINIKILPGTAAQAALCVGCFINDDNTVLGTSFDALNEQTAAKYKYIPAGANNTNNLTLNWSLKKQFGGSALANNDLQGTASANPVEQSTYIVYLQALDKATTTAVFIETTITYTAIWAELRDIAQS